MRTRLKPRRVPMGMTVNGGAELTVQDAAGYQEILDRLEHAEALAAVRQGMEQFERGEGIPWGEAEKRLRKKHGFSR